MTMAVNTSGLLPHQCMRHILEKEREQRQVHRRGEEEEGTGGSSPNVAAS